jgi:hypothetical protein
MDDATFFQAVFEFLEHKFEPDIKDDRSHLHVMEVLSTLQPLPPASRSQLDFKELHEYVERTPLPTVSRSHWDAEMEVLSAELAAKKREWSQSQTPKTEAPGDSIKEMPEVLQAIIQDFARPLCRGDWRTCKRDESRAIYLCQRDKRHAVADFIGGPEFWDIVVAQSFYELLKNYPPGPGSDEGQTTIQLRRHWG